MDKKTIIYLLAAVITITSGIFGMWETWIKPYMESISPSEQIQPQIKAVITSPATIFAYDRKQPTIPITISGNYPHDGMIDVILSDYNLNENYNQDLLYIRNIQLNETSFFVNEGISEKTLLLGLEVERGMATNYFVDDLDYNEKIGTLFFTIRYHNPLNEKISIVNTEADLFLRSTNHP